MGFEFSNKINHISFIKDFTSESVYILGLLWADGYINKKSNAISIECNREDIDFFYPIFKETGEYNLYYRHRKNRKEQGIINCSSYELSNFLKDNDYLEKSLLSPNKILSKIPENLIHYFYLGWSDGDGCFYYNTKKTLIQFIISGSYEQDWSSLINICKKLEINYKVDRFMTNKNHKYSRFLIHRNEDILNFGNFIYSGKNLGLSRKFEKFFEIKQYIMGKKTNLFQCFDKNNILVKNFNSLKTASDWVNKGKYVGGSINDCIIGRQPTAYGYIWKKIKTELPPIHQF